MTWYAAPQHLRDLAFRYAQAVDTLDADMLTRVFTHDGAVRGFGDNPMEFQGAAGLASIVAHVGSSFQKTMHNVFNQIFDIGPEGRITGQTHCIASHILPGDEWTLLDMAIRYHDSYREEAGRWKFAERRLEVLWTETRAVQKFDPGAMRANAAQGQG